MNTCYGIVLSKDGLASRKELRQRSWALRARDARRWQPSRIPVDRDHDGQPVGQVVHLERDDQQRLWAVALVDPSVRPELRVRLSATETRSVPHDLFFSVEASHTWDYRDIQILAVSLTASPARLSATPVRFLPDEPYLACRTSNDKHERRLLEAAAETIRGRHGGPLVVRDHDDERMLSLDPRTSPEAWERREQQRAELARHLRPAGPIEHSAPHRGVLRVS